MRQRVGMLLGKVCCNRIKTPHTLLCNHVDFFLAASRQLLEQSELKEVQL
jgi:hypothetical protein